MDAQIDLGKHWSADDEPGKPSLEVAPTTLSTFFFL